MSSLGSRWALGDDQEDMNNGAAPAGHAEAHERRPSRQKSNKSSRRDWCPPHVPIADQDVEPPTMSSWCESSVGAVAEPGGTSRGMFSGDLSGSGSSNKLNSRAQDAGSVGVKGTGAGSSSSRWNKFLR